MQKYLNMFKKKELNKNFKDVTDIIEQCNPDLITPIEALNKLNLIKKILENKT
ncbi:MAG TPA: hypothetical protein ACYCC8_01510 [Candidatus Azoamicus sp.]